MLKQRLILGLFIPGLLLILLLTLPLYFLSIIGNPQKAWLIAVSLDELGNILTGGQENRTISFRAAVAEQQGILWGCLLCRVLDKLDVGHCLKALIDKQQNGKV